MTTQRLIPALNGFLLGVGLLSVVLAVPAWGDALTLRMLGPEMSVADRIGLIDRFMHERYYDPTGLIYSHINWDKERPFIADDSTMPAPEPWQWMSYENSPFISGIFLTAQCYRYHATRDPEALEYARQAYGSIDANYRLTEQRDSAAGGLSQKAGFIDLAAQPRSRKSSS